MFKSLFGNGLQLSTAPMMFDGLVYGAMTPGNVLQDIDGFPYDIYSSNFTRYEKAMSWFTGRALEPEDKNATVEEYPVRINPLNGTCLKHAYALFGEFQDDGRPMVLPRLIIDSTVGKEQRKAMRESAKVAESALYHLWYENFGRTLMMRNAITSQILGGSVFNIRYVPWQTYRNIPLQVERISPENFVGFTEPGDEFRLSEAWTIRPITPKDALRYGVDVPVGQRAYWTEHWDMDKYTVRINNEPLKPYTVRGIEVKGEGANPFGFVPTTYIPHIRVGGFYGENVIDNLIGIVKEINLRWADTGDAHNADTHAYVGMSNVNGTPKVIKYPGLNVMDLGSADALGTGAHDPTMFEVRKPSITAPSITYMNELLNQYRRDANLPAVADGEDQGSQRSAATLVTRMWPLVAHTNTERMNWSSGLDWFTQMALRMMKIKGLGKITEEHISMRTRQVWAAILPKDRETFSNELVNRAAHNLGSLEHLIEMTGDVEDVDQEMELIAEWETKKAEFKAKENPAPMPGQIPGAKPAATPAKPTSAGKSK